MTSPTEPHSSVFSHINGSQEDLLDRLAVAEICKGWPVYRDASEWQNFRSLFAPKAHVWTTWSGGLSIEDFIDVSKAGKAKGVFIQHRECGTLVEMGPASPAGLEVLGERDGDAAAEHTNGTAGGGGAGTGNGNGHAHSAHGTSAPRSIRRAVGKMKATITQRFVNPEDGIEYDVDCDCRFIFFCEKVVGVADTDVSGAWRTVYVKLFYEKDKIVPADGRSAPTITAEERKYMQQLPEGYKYLGVMQRRLGYQIDEKLPTPRNVGWPKMYTAMESWLAGKQAELTWE